MNIKHALISTAAAISLLASSSIFAATTPVPIIKLANFTHAKLVFTIKNGGKKYDEALAASQERNIRLEGGYNNLMGSFLLNDTTNHVTCDVPTSIPTDINIVKFAAVKSSAGLTCLVSLGKQPNQ